MKKRNTHVGEALEYLWIGMVEGNRWRRGMKGGQSACGRGKKSSTGKEEKTW